MTMQEKKRKMLTLRGKKGLLKENVQLKKQLKRQEALLKANATQVDTMIEYLKDMKGFVDEHVEFMSKLVKHGEHWKLKERGALEKVIHEGQH